MTAQAIALNKKGSPANLRAFDVRRDLLAVADLVELCFQDSLDSDGRYYIQQMRETAHSGKFLGFAPGGSRGNMPPGGFVWLEEGRLLGNLSLIPVRSPGINRFLIANVAVHPNYRRRGIARSLTQAALERAKLRGSTQVWLQVDEENAAAQKLYRNMGFVERAHRKTWQAYPQPEKSRAAATTIRVRARRSPDWPQQRAWLENIYPSEVRWNLSLDMKPLEPGWRGSLKRLTGERHFEQWAAVIRSALLGVLSWQSSALQADHLWLAAPPEHEEQALFALLAHAHHHLRPDRPLALNYPAGRLEKAFAASGFAPARSLIWMQYQPEVS